MSKIICALKSAICVLSMVIVASSEAMYNGNSKQSTDATSKSDPIVQGLSRAIEKKDLNRVKGWLEWIHPVHWKETINKPVDGKRTLLHLAVYSKNFSKEIVEFLIDNGADLEAHGIPEMVVDIGSGRDVHGNPVSMIIGGERVSDYSPGTPLRVAIKEGNIEAVKILVARGAQLTDHNTWHALSCAIAGSTSLPDGERTAIIDLLLNNDPTLYETTPIAPETIAKNCAMLRAKEHFLSIAAYLKSWKESH